jgi:hypothetical protein
MKFWLYYFYYSLKYLYYSVFKKQFEKGDLLTMEKDVYMVTTVTPLTVTMRKVRDFDNTETTRIIDGLDDVNKL